MLWVRGFDATPPKYTWRREINLPIVTIMRRLKQLLGRAETHCADENRFLGKVCAMARDGAGKLQVKKKVIILSSGRAACGRGTCGGRKLDIPVISMLFTGYE